jgi:uncharacterized protein (DUF1810 family)
MPECARGASEAGLSRLSLIAYRSAISAPEEAHMGRISMASFTLFGIAALASPAAQAQGVVTIQKLSAALANELVGESVAECAKKNYAVTAVVVDLDGQR